MKLEMKKTIAVVIAAVLLICLSAWQRPSHTGDELKKLGMDPGLGSTTLRIDSRQGIDKKGILKAIIEFPGSIEEEIYADSRWQPLPMSGDAQKIFAELTQKDGKFIPSLGSGAYIYLNGNYGGPAYNREKPDLIFAVYSPSQNRIYYYEAKE